MIYRTKFFMLLSLIALIPACASTISINTSPPGAEAKLTEFGGDKVITLGVTPVKKTVNASGEYNLSLDKAGFSPYRKNIDLGKAGDLNIELVPVYEMSIDTQPQGANASIEDKGSAYVYNIGKTPVTYVVEGRGPFILSVKMQGYETETVQLDSSPGKTQVLKTITLRPAGR